jgi:hypothetical protein
LIYQNITDEREREKREKKRKDIEWHFKSSKISQSEIGTIIG